MAEPESTRTPQFVFTAEQQELRSAVRRFCTEFSDEQSVRRLMDSDVAHDPELWSRLGSELGVLGLGVPEELGGSGGDVVDTAIVVEELGAAVYCGPVFGTVLLSIPALAACPDSTLRADILDALVAGTRTAAFAVPDRAGEFAADTVTVTSSGPDGDRTVSGTIEQVVDGVVAKDLLVTAAGADGVSLYVVDVDAPGVRRTRLCTMDQTRNQATVHLDAAPARLLAGPDRTLEICSHAMQVGATLLAAEQVGLGQHLLDLSTEHATNRVQFGRPIGSFQAVKHRIADMLVEQEHARSAAYHAAWTLRDDPPDTILTTSMAQALCSAASTRIAADTVQVHGGIGFTWEHQAHLYFKRAFGDAALLGGAEEHRDRVAELVIDCATADHEITVAAG